MTPHRRLKWQPHIMHGVARCTQSPVALSRYLENIGHKECNAAMKALIKWTEQTFDKSVSAVQVGHGAWPRGRPGPRALGR